jgi:hypothetical protein
MTRGPAALWTTVMQCHTKEELDTWLADNPNWRSYTTQDGLKEATDVYSCKYSSRNREGKFDCKAKMRIRYPKNSSPALIQMTGEHEHTRLKDDGLSTPVKQRIQAHDEPHSGRTAGQIQRALEVGAHILDSWNTEIFKTIRISKG